MKRMTAFLFLALFVFTDTNSQEPRQKLLMDYNWKFHLGEVEEGSDPVLDDSEWRVLNLPHDWSVEGEYNQEAPAGGRGGYLPGGIAWYRKAFKIPGSTKGKTVWIDFDGIYMNSEVWINGHYLGKRPYGYIGFYYDLTPYLVNGENLIAVRVDNSSQPNSRWYSGSGIYRHVWLSIMNDVHVSHWGVYVTTPEITKDEASINVKTSIERSTSGSKKLILKTSVFDNEGNEVSRNEDQIELKPGSSDELKTSLTIKDPKLWSVESPDMYSLISEIIDGKKVIDKTYTPFGIRSIEYDIDRGLLLNGEQVKMNGVCLHHDGGAVGAAVPIKIWERRFKILKEMGCNAIRTAHNPMASDFMDLCDQMGFLVMNEAFDEWKGGKVPHGYSNYFDDWSQADLVSFIHRDRNHPSVVMWSAGNEIGEQSIAGGHEVLKPLIETFHREDPTRPVTTGNDHIAADGRTATMEFLNMLDIVGYNYADRWHERRELYYSIDRFNHPDWRMVGTESVSNGGIRGWYPVGDDPALVNPGYNSRMIRAEQLWKFVSLHDYVIGEFMWTGIDYLGEARWPHKNASSGVIDMCGFPKDGYYFYQSQWTLKPVLHIFPHWNWKGREGQIFPVLAYTNCDTVELYLNGKPFGAKAYELPRQGTSGGWNSYERPFLRTTTADLHLSWDVPYEPGVLKAIGKKNGEVVITEEVRTTGDPYAIRLTADRSQIDANGMDVVHVVVEILDEKDQQVPLADNLVRFQIEGEGKLIGVDNGNPADHNSFKINERKGFNGLAMAIVQSTMKPGKIRITAYSEELKGDIIEIYTTRTDIIPHIK